ncbi:MAG: TRAP transporter small permease [Limnohabitans sp.]|nr:TRAP transporter small permease [Limnohabitans sp.]
MIRKLNDWVTKACMVAAALWAFVLCFLVVADVGGRVLLNSPVKGTPEIISLSIVIICFLQAGFAIRSGGMLNVDTFVSRLSPRTQSWMAVWGALIGIVFFAVICNGSIDGAAHAWNSGEYEGEGALRVPVWPAKFIIVGGTALAAFNYFLLIVQNVGHAKRGELPNFAVSQH